MPKVKDRSRTGRTTGTRARRSPRGRAMTGVRAIAGARPGSGAPSRQPSRLRPRKDSHLRLCLEEDVTPNPNNFDLWRLVPTALPEIDFARIDTGVEWLGRRLELPLLIASITGGATAAAALNRRLAHAAQHHRVALALGSCRILLEDPRALSSFDVRGFAPDILLFANLGAVQLNYGVGVDDCRRICDLLRADGLVLHLNPMQEAIQPEGDRDFSGLLAKIEDLVRRLDRPIVVKEVGCGISGEVARQLAAAGVRHIDVSGRGGTSWPYVEAMRGGAAGAEAFADWGIPTPEALREAREVPGVTLLAGGGLRGGLDLAKALALGAHLGSFALPFARAAHESDRAVERLLERIHHEFRLAMFGVGAMDTESLHRARIVRD